jgi:hypothetical protein
MVLEKIWLSHTILTGPIRLHSASTDITMRLASLVKRLKSHLTDELGRRIAPRLLLQRDITPFDFNIWMPIFLKHQVKYVFDGSIITKNRA